MQTIYKFGNGTADGNASMVEVLGGKGAHLAEMSGMGLPIPPGFTIPTEFCRRYMAEGDSVVDQVFAEASDTYGTMCEEQNNPHLMVSVRSGAAISMPGMMNTILNVGLTPAGFEHWGKLLGKRTTLDCYRRLIQMLGSTAYGIEDSVFEDLLAKARFRAKVQQDFELDEDHLAELVKAYSIAFQLHAGVPFPMTVGEQLRAAIGAVFKSWMQPRAVTYRDLNKISHDMGTAVTVQTMVFGNLNNNSGSGVLFTRHPTTGKNEIMGEFLPNAQGEDVVAGIRTPLPMDELYKKWPGVGKKITQMCAQLESHYEDMMDVEFTVQNKQLYLLQCRVGKRSSLAKLVIAADMVEEGRIAVQAALGRITRDDVRLVLQPRVDPAFTMEPTWVGIGSTIGVATGRVVLTAADAIACTEPCILVRAETDPDDIGGMAAAVGILTRTGGATSHAAVVARAMNKPAVVGCTTLREDLQSLDGHKITICGATGRVWLDAEVPVADASHTPQITALARYACMTDNSGLSFAVMPGTPTQELLHVKKLHLTREWAMSASTEQVYNLFAQLHPGVDVTLDLRTNGTSDDDEIEGLLGPAPAPVDEGFPDWVNHNLCIKYGRVRVTRVLGSGELSKFLKSKGFKVMEAAQSLDDLLTHRSLDATPELIGALGVSTFTKLTAALKQAGFSKSSVSLAPPAYTLMAALA